jgi:hypothetical protein
MGAPHEEVSMQMGAPGGESMQMGAPDDEESMSMRTPDEPM